MTKKIILIFTLFNVSIALNAASYQQTDPILTKGSEEIDPELYSKPKIPQLDLRRFSGKQSSADQDPALQAISPRELEEIRAHEEFLSGQRSNRSTRSTSSINLSSRGTMQEVAEEITAQVRSELMRELEKRDSKIRELNEKVKELELKNKSTDALCNIQ